MILHCPLLEHTGGYVSFQDLTVLISFHSIHRLVSTRYETPISLEPHAVHLWGLELDGSSGCLEPCVSSLDTIEQHRAARFVREEDRRRYVLAHGGLRAVLSRYLGVSPSEVALDRTDAGKPCLTRAWRDRSALTFNLSHAHGRALIAVSNAQEVGVDVERVRPAVDVGKLSERFFTRAEHLVIMQARPEQRAAMFFRYWVAKEAVLKAQGIGLRGLSECEIVLRTDEIATEGEVRPAAHLQQKLKVRLLACEQGWEAAVAAQTLDRVTQVG